jgi:hypothetical protein
LKILDHTQLETHIHTRSVGLLSTSDKLDTPTEHTTNTTDENPCPQRNSNLRFQKSSGYNPALWCNYKYSFFDGHNKQVIKYA